MTNSKKEHLGKIDELARNIKEVFNEVEATSKEKLHALIRCKAAMIVAIGDSEVEQESEKLLKFYLEMFRDIENLEEFKNGKLNKRAS